MATTRPLVTIYNGKDCSAGGSAVMPSVFLSPLRPDLVRFVFTNIAKNSRQAYGVTPNAGYQTSAESWGTGRAVSRIPRVPGGGTHRAGQAAFGNMCRQGGMFAPNKTWRRWHRKVNVTMKRHAVATAVAATALPPLVMARGHRIDQVPELPLVLDDGVEALTKTKEAVRVLGSVGLADELAKVKASKKLNAGRGKSRNRRYTMRRGPLVIYQGDSGITRAFRNIPGVELCHVDRLNLLKLAPGGTLGRMCIWSASAFKRLQELYGKQGGVGTAPLKKGYHLPRPMMTNADLARIINSEEIQSVVRPALKSLPKRRQHKNLITNRAALIRVNPAAKTLKRQATLAQTPGRQPHRLLQKAKEARLVEKRANRKKGREFMKEVLESFADKAKEALAAAAAPAPAPETEEEE